MDFELSFFRATQVRQIANFTVVDGIYYMHPKHQETGTPRLDGLLVLFGFLASALACRTVGCIQQSLLFSKMVQHKAQPVGLYNGSPKCREHIIMDTLPGSLATKVWKMPS